MTRRRYVVWGASLALATLLIVLAVSAAWLAHAYDGTCGGYQPWLAAARPCTLAEYVTRSPALLALMAWTEFWPLIVVLLAASIGIGYVLDRRRRRPAP